MPNDITIKPYGVDTFLEARLREKKTARDFQERKHLDWNENYDLSRGKVKTNRLTQRQAVNIPLMKETEKTIMAKIDEPPNIEWKELGGDEKKEIVLQALWDDFYKVRNLEAVDIQDKKTCLRYGRPTKKIVPSASGYFPEVYALDIYDVVYDPLMDPLNIESARFVIHQNIFKTLREILADDRYDKDGKDKLAQWAATDFGVIQAGKNKEQYQKKMDRMIDMGLSSDKFKEFAGGDVLVSITEHYYSQWNEKKKLFERRCCVYADDSTKLMDELLVDLIGIDEYPFITWAEDVETNDLWNDSIDDMVRVPNKIINVWFSQLTENRTLKNFQMHWYDSTDEKYSPQTYEPGPGRMLPAPGNPRETIMPVDISGLDDTMEAINMLTMIVERGTGATAIDKGVGEQQKQTLGEVQILVGKAMERATNIAKFYRRSWYDFARKWLLIMEANANGKKSLYKRGRSGRMYEKIVYRGDWVSKSGYEAIVRSSSEQEQEQVKSIQRWQFILQQFPNNAALRTIAQKRELELLDITPEELKQVEEEEKRAAQQPQVVPPNQQNAIDQSQNQSAGIQSQIQQQLAQLAQ